MRNLFGLIFLFLVFQAAAQNNLAGLLQSKKWVMHYSSLIDSASLSGQTFDRESRRDYRHQFEFLNGGKIKYTDLLTDYDPHGEGGCSNSFANYSGTWKVKNKKIYLELEYNSISEKRFLVNRYTLQKEGNDVLMTPVK